jgi:CRISPR-associated protein (TIGR02710 family)
MVERILLCTVGGSYQPIIQAVQQLSPDLTVFVCSEGKSSSVSMINGKGKVIKEYPGDEKYSLPNIPTQLNLSNESYKIITVPPDDLDKVFKILLSYLNDIKNNYHKATLYADYTGGTKSMTAGLILASLEHEIKLHLIKGARTNLDKVSEGTQWAVPASVDWIKFYRTMHNHLTSWKQYAYGQAVKCLITMDLPSDSVLQENFFKAKILSQAFDAWDRFDHKKAKSLLSTYRSEINPQYVPYFLILDVLCDQEKQVTELTRIYDLWLNALRRSAQGRYDDAIARVYRIIEWTAQWVLQEQCGVSTSDLPEDFIPTGVDIRKNRHGKYQAPLYHSWQLVRHKTTGPLSEFIKTKGDSLLTFLEVRNQSILAHGKEPITEQKWKEAKSWFETNILPPFQETLKTAGLKKIPPQLPDTYEWL